jgi:hypothetical protein
MHVNFLDLKDDLVFFKHLFLKALYLSSTQINLFIHIIGAKCRTCLLQSMIKSLNVKPTTVFDRLVIVSPFYDFRRREFLLE